MFFWAMTLRSTQKYFNSVILLINSNYPITLIVPPKPSIACSMGTNGLFYVKALRTPWLFRFSSCIIMLCRWFPQKRLPKNKEIGIYLQCLAWISLHEHFFTKKISWEYKNPQNERATQNNDLVRCMLALWILKYSRHHIHYRR